MEKEKHNKKQLLLDVTGKGSFYGDQISFSTYR